MRITPSHLHVSARQWPAASRWPWLAPLRVLPALSMGLTVLWLPLLERSPNFNKWARTLSTLWFLSTMCAESRKDITKLVFHQPMQALLAENLLRSRTRQRLVGSLCPASSPPDCTSSLSLSEQNNRFPVSSVISIRTMQHCVIILIRGTMNTNTTTLVVWKGNDVIFRNCFARQVWIYQPYL